MPAAFLPAAVSPPHLYAVAVMKLYLQRPLGELKEGPCLGDGTLLVWGGTGGVWQLCARHTCKGEAHMAPAHVVPSCMPHPGMHVE